MSEIRQITPHPEADTLSAFAENALPALEREQTLQHLAACEDCRAIVFLAQDAALADQPTLPQRVAAVRRPWFSMAVFAWPAAAALAAVMAFTIYLRRPSFIRPVPPSTNHASVQQPPLSQNIPPPELPATFPRRIPKLEVSSTPPRPHAPSVLGGLASGSADVGTQLSSQQIESLPIEGRSVSNLPLQAANGLAGSEQRTATSGLGVGRGAAPVIEQDQLQAAAPLPTTPAPPRAVTLGAPIAAPAPQPSKQTVTVSAEAAELSVDTSTVSSVLSTATMPPHLPSHLAVTSTSTSGSQALATDTAGALFRSTDSGRHWKQVRAPWAGSALHVSLLSAATLPSAITLDGALAQGTVAQYAAQTPPRTISEAALPISLQGKVTDATGAAISGASVAVTTPFASTPRTITTDATGKFAIHGLAPGVYHVQVEAPGFQVTQMQTTLAANQQPPLNIMLPVGTEAETVTVQTSSTALSQTVKGTARARRASTVPPVFELTTDKGTVWVSSDGLHWQPR